MTAMAHDIRRALDPVLIAADCGISLDEWQADLMRSTAPRVLLLCARQTGKSTVSSLIALATAIRQAGALVLLVSPSQRQSGELFRSVMRHLRALENAPQITAESALRLELANGSRIVALPGDEHAIRQAWRLLRGMDWRSQLAPGQGVRRPVSAHLQGIPGRGTARTRRTTLF